MFFFFFFFTHVAQVAAERIVRVQQTMQVFQVGSRLIDVQLQVREAVLSSDAILALDVDALVEIAQLIHVPV